MKLRELKEYFEKFPDNHVFDYGLSEPFSWRGSYDEVAFRFERDIFTKEEILKNINKAYTQTFTGYKGGEYMYQDYTTVNFEESYRDYTDNTYVLQKLFCFLFEK